MTAIGVVTLFAVAILVLSTASAGVTRLSTADDPLLSAVLAHPTSPMARVLARIVGVGALFALVATLFSLIFAASRQFYYLGQSRYLPEVLASTSRRGVPSVATIAAGLSLLVMMTCIQLELIALTCTLIGLSAMFLYFRYTRCAG